MAENAAERALRLLDIVPYVVQNQGISVSELAKHFSVTKAEILKDLNTLFLCGLPGYTPLELIDLSVEDDLVVIRDPQNLSAPRNFTYSEALILRIALAALQETVPSGSDRYRNLIKLREKFEAMFSEDIPSGAIHVELDKQGFALELAKRAIQEHKDLLIRYLNVAQDVITERRVTPDTVQVQGERVLLHGYCHLAKGARSFNLKYIQSIEISDQVEDGREISTVSNEALSITLSIPDQSSSFYESNKDFLEPLTDNKYVIKMHNVNWLLRKVFSEPGAKIELPKAIRSKISEEAANALARYNV